MTWDEYKKLSIENDELTRKLNEVKLACVKLGKARVFNDFDKSKDFSVDFMMRLTLLYNKAGIFSDTHPDVIKAKEYFNE